MLGALRTLASGPGLVAITLTELNPHNAAADDGLLERFVASFADAISLNGVPAAESTAAQKTRKDSRSMETATKTRFTFTSDDETLVGNLFLPDRSAPAGVVVAVGPLTSVKEQASGTYAQAMAERGYAGLAFDYRYFGESGGQPRQFENPEANIEDIKNAADALLADDRLSGPTPLRTRGLLRRRADGPFGRPGPALPCVRRCRRRVQRPGEDRREDGHCISSENRSRPRRRTQVARDGRGGNHPSRRARRRRRRDAAARGLRVLRDSARPCPTTSTATPSSLWRTAFPSTRAARRVRSMFRC